MTNVVSCFLIHDNKVLLLKRSNKVKTYKGLWGGVAGYVESEETPDQTALKEIREEAGLTEDDVVFVKKGDPVSFSDSYEGVTYNWVVHPFVFEVLDKDKVHIDWEHSEYRWISPADINKYKTAPHLKEIISKMLL